MSRNPVHVVTPPAAEPVTRAELVAQLRLNDATGLDAELDRAITTARELFERQTGRAVLPTTFRQFAKCFPAFGIALQVGPVLSLESVTYFDQADAEQELGGCELDDAEIPAVVYLPSADYPAVSAKIRRPVRVDFVAGWADADSVPATVKTAVLLLAAHFYENREAYRDGADMSATPEGWARVIELYRTGLEWAA